MPASSTPPADRGEAAGFLLNKYGFLDEDVRKAVRDRNGLLNKLTQNLGYVSELLIDCGSTQIRRVVLRNTRFLRVFMEDKDIANLDFSDSKTVNSSEDRLKSAISLLQRLGFEGEALSESVAGQPHLLTTSGEKVMDSFKLAEDLSFRKGSNLFTDAVGAILGVGKENLDKKLRCLGSLGFPEKQVSDLWRREPWVLGLSEEKLKNYVDVLVSSAGIPLDDLAKYLTLLGYSLERRMIPRYRVIEALKSMQVLKTEMGFPRFVDLLGRRFVEKYLSSNAKSYSVPPDIYHGGKARKLIIDKETYSEPVKKIQQNCGISSLTPSSSQDRSVVTDFLFNKCGLTEQDILCNGLLCGKSGQKLDDVLELLNDCGLTAHLQIQRLVVGNPTIYKCKRNLKSRIRFLKTFMRKKIFRTRLYWLRDC